MRTTKTSKTMLIVLLLLVPFYAMKASDAGVSENIRIGSDYETCSKLLKTQYGRAIKPSAQEIIFYQKDFQGITYDQLIFSFKNQKLSCIHGLIRASNKYQADRTVARIAKEYEKKYDLSKDYDDRSYFYKGGLAPSGIGFLFTIFSAKRQGKWNAEIRYGPF